MTAQLGKIGIWRPHTDLSPELAVEVEKLGYGTIWVGGSPPADLGVVERLLEATDGIAVATGIVNIWNSDAKAVAESYHRVTEKHPDRLLLGIGAGHREATAEYTKPYTALVNYLDVLDAEGVPASGRVLAALGPRVLELARDRAAGAHPYLTVPAHTEKARSVLGAEPILAPEQKVVLDPDPQRARTTARPMIQFYLRLNNYTRNLKRFGYTDQDVAGTGSDRLVDDLAVHGTAEEIATRLKSHVEAGANHVAIQPLGEDPLSAYKALATALS
ncbi:LLM class F420-dependent oxidoreductase [Saccharopolyspora griseoalba]|uniref:LLM class F420-dependent oxidoreductase n=1 Tax=Saccharopolyspora griseoalba TaxID=1431848 RepID=A0ABW2LL66_9PSEU